MTKVLGKIRTADGFVFYHLLGVPAGINGRVVDNLDPSAVDMSWDSLQEFAVSNSDNLPNTDGAVLWTYMAHPNN